MSRRRPFREHLPFTPRHEEHFRWRGREVSRLEGFTDAVFAFAVTLLIVALEVPHTYAGLMNVVRSFPAFVASFALLMLFWFEHYRYFRRYGLQDTFTQVVTMAILVFVLFAVYPLKFLFTLISVNVFHLAIEPAPQIASFAEGRTLYLLYSGGFAAVWFLYALLYRHALARREALGLNRRETIQSRGTLCGIAIQVGVSALSVIFALTLPDRLVDWLPGVIYALLGPLMTFNGWWHGRQVRQSLNDSSPPLAA